MRTALALPKEKAVHSSVRGEGASVLLLLRQGELESLSWVRDTLMSLQRKGILSITGCLYNKLKTY